MSTHHIVRTHRIVNSFRVQQVRGMFDFQSESADHEWNSNLPVDEKPWNIGLIVGPSGSGKTTLAREAFKEFHIHESNEWPQDKSVVDGFSDTLETKAIVSMLNSVGFSSPPSWLKPYAILSNGQKFRCDLARCLLEYSGGIVFDEFTSVVDRDVAKIGCAAVSKAIRRKPDSKFVAVSCHYDIIDWLDPDWVFDVGAQSFEWRARRRHPQIVVDVREASHSAWSLFREHHYLNKELASHSASFVATWNGHPVGFTSYIHFPHASCATFKREHRTVVLPDFQGVGIGNRLSEFVASHCKRRGFRFVSSTSNPAMINHRSASKLWSMHRMGRAAKPSESSNIKQLGKSNSRRRITAGFEYIGP